MKITDALLTMGASHGRTGRAINPRGIVVHSVAIPGSSAIANRNYFENGSNGRGDSSHYIVGLQGEVIRCIPEAESAQHAGAVRSTAYLEQAKINNSVYFSIEACYPNVDGKFSDITNLRLIELCADICVRFGFDPHKCLFTHNQVTGKPCPLYFVNHPEDWTAFKLEVQNMISNICLPPGHINLSIDKKSYMVKAVNLNGRLYSNLNDIIKILTGKRIVNIREVLEANGYTVTWNESLQRITAITDNIKTFSHMNENF